MYSKEQLKSLISEMSGDLIEVKNIKQLNDEQCNGLKVGDVVAKKTGKQYHLYLVTYKQDKHGLCLSYFDASCIETQSYDYTAGHWVYNSEDKTSFADIGGLPDVTGADNGKVLEVLAGAWGKGNRKVNVIDAPASTTLSDELYNIIKDGVFMKGTFAGYYNPVIFPFTPEQVNTGFIIGVHNNRIKLSCYSINPTTKVFTVGTELIQAWSSGDQISMYAGYMVTRNLTASSLKLSNKDFPEYPANTESKVLVCDLGTLKYDNIKKEIDVSNLGTIASSTIATGFYKNTIAYTDGIGNEDCIFVKMSNGAVYPMINDSANSQLVVFNGIDFENTPLTISKCWKVQY